MKATGRCLCGEVRFEVESGDGAVHACHCSMCRRWAGGPAFVVIVDSFDLVSGSVSRYESSQWAERGFCARCGSGLFYRLKDADRYFVSMGAFDDQTPFSLVDEIYIDEKPPAYDFAGDHRRMTGQEFLDLLQQDET